MLSQKNKGIALRSAALNEHFEGVKLLIETPDFLNDVSAEDKGIALRYAASGGNLEVLKLLIETPDFLNDVSAEDKGHALHNIARKKCFEGVKLLIETPGFLNDVSDKDKGIALRSAALNEHFEGVKLLIETPDFLNDVSAEDKGIALRYAASGGNLEVLKLLIETPDFLNDVSAEDKGIALRSCMRNNNLNSLFLLYNCMDERERHGHKKEIITWAEELTSQAHQKLSEFISGIEEHCGLNEHHSQKIGNFFMPDIVITAYKEIGDIHREFYIPEPIRVLFELFRVCVDKACLNSSYPILVKSNVCFVPTLSFQSPPPQLSTISSSDAIEAIDSTVQEGVTEAAFYHARYNKEEEEFKVQAKR
jgi:ankyrin repeat protein